MSSSLTIFSTKQSVVLCYVTIIEFRAILKATTPEVTKFITIIILVNLKILKLVKR